MTELHMDWWTREENSWATIGVRIKDVTIILGLIEATDAIRPTRHDYEP